MLKGSQNGPREPLNVVVLGGTKGFGNSLVRKFHAQGHRVLFTGRSNAHVQEQTGSRLIRLKHDVSDPEGFTPLTTTIHRSMPGGVDVWVNNAAVSDNYAYFHEHSPQRVAEILHTNLTGSILSTRHAIEVIKDNTSGHMGHIFNVVGAGSNGMPTPQFSVYGATKAGLSQFVRSIRAELKQWHGDIGLHLISPGMMPTDLLALNASPTQLRMFNILAEDPDIVAAYVYERILDIVENKRTKTDIRYMTLQRIVHSVLTFREREGRFFEESP